ncbi:Major facilitator family transporter [uncultured delta proteobacterium]|uniref:Major facilitator family transporter n=1 Tax=uncultured delta proteobacterium TaxID=34034 RepID=A0A212JZZ1_9DELT|nr:Major facilitator family transporter [uncultured delta proteobacterium]
MQRRYWIEALTFFSYAFFAFSWVSGSFMMPDIMTSFAIEKISDVTWATNAVSIAKIIGNFLAASILMFFGMKKAFLGASLLIAAGFFGALAENYAVFVLSRLVMGLGGAILFVYFNPIVVRYFTPSERPVINGINSAPFAFGAFLAVMFTPSLLAAFGAWQTVLLALSACSLALLVAALFILEDFSLTPGTPGSTATDKAYTMAEGLRDPINWILPFSYSGMLFLYLAVFSLFPLAPGFAVSVSSLATVYIASGLAGSIGGAMAVKRFSRRLPVIRYSGLFVALCAGVMLYTDSPALAYAMACVSGFLMFFPVPAMYTLVQELPGMSTGRITLIFSMFWSFSYVISGILMYMAGIIADATGSVTVAVFFAAACPVTFFIGTFVLPETGCPPEA